MRVLHLQEPFSDLMKESTIFINRDALTPHYVPEQLLYRDKQINGIVKALTPALKGSRGRNLFIYGKTGTGKTCCIKYVIDKVSRLPSVRSKISYVPCKIYNSRYRVLNKIMSDHLPVYAKRGYGVVDIYEKMINWVEEDGKTLIVVMDEIDMVKDLDDIMYTLTRANSDVKHGGITIVGISNNISFKEDLDPRSISSLYETELVFPPYNSSELAEIMKQRAELGLKKDAVDASVINLIAAISAKESGDARLALKTLSMAGELAEEANRNKILVEDVQKAARNADEEIAYELVGMLPEHQRLVIYYQTAFRKPIISGYLSRENQTQLSSVSAIPLSVEAQNLEAGNGFYYASPISENYSVLTKLWLAMYNVRFIAMLRQAYNYSEQAQLYSYLYSEFGQPVYADNSTFIFMVNNTAQQQITAYYNGAWLPGAEICYIEGQQACPSSFASDWWFQGYGNVVAFVPFNATSAILNFTASGYLSNESMDIALSNPYNIIDTIKLGKSSRRYSVRLDMNRGLNDIIFYAQQGSQQNLYGLDNITISEAQNAST